MAVIENERRKAVFRRMRLEIILLANIFLFIPVTIYVGNYGEFKTPIWKILHLYSIPALTLLALFAVVGFLIRGELLRRYTVVLAALIVLVWFQGSVVVWDYGLMDGQAIDWSKDSWRGWVDLAAWSTMLLGAIVYYHNIEKPIVQMAYVAFLIQLVFFSCNVIELGDRLFSKSVASNSNDSLSEIHKFSTEKNVLHIVLDGFQSDVFEELITSKAIGGQYRSALKGFVFYNETMGVFPYTRFSVPAFLSGKIYKNNITKDEFVMSTIKGDTILNAAYMSGYEVDLVAEEYWIDEYKKGLHTNAYTIPNNYHVSDKAFAIGNSFKLFDLVLFRMAPHYLKREIYNNQSWLIYPLMIDAEYMQFWFFSHSAFADGLTRNMTVERTSPVYKYLHLQTTHAPMVVNKDCSYAGGVLPRNRLTVTVQSKCALDVIVRLFEGMKQKGIYDDTLIILMADHGAHIPPYRFKKHLQPNGEEINPWMAAMITPLLAIKMPNAKGSLRMSPLLASLTDLPDTVASILHLKDKFNGRVVMDLDPEEKRERRHYYYAWQRDAWETDYTGPIQEYIVNGSLYDGPWRLGREFLPPKE